MFLMMVLTGTLFILFGIENKSLRTTATEASVPDEIFTLWQEPLLLPEARFIDEQGQEMTLADFRGKYLLLNIWATWCSPCREEMPALNRLQEKMGGAGFEVMPISIDSYNTNGINLVKEFYLKYKLNNLGVYLDSSGELSSSLNVIGVPTTLLIDPEGLEIGRKVGVAEWDSDEFIAEIRGHMRLSN
jgi:thiol-disulfide isomerase/thioredoxin